MDTKEEKSFEESCLSALLAIRVANRSVAKSSDVFEELGKDLKKESVTMEPFYKRGKDAVKDVPAGYVFTSVKDGVTTLTVAYHGTREVSEIRDDLKYGKTKTNLGGIEADIHKGFSNQYELSRDSLNEILEKKKNSEGKLPETIFTGHSLGGALAQMAAMDHHKSCDIEKTTVLTFGSPRVFSKETAKKYSELGLSEKTTLVQHSQDVVPKIPFGSQGFKHVGTKVKVDGGKSAVVKHSASFYRDSAKQKMSEEAELGSKDSKKLTVVSLDNYTNIFKAIVQRIKSVGKMVSNFRNKTETKEKNSSLSTTPISKQKSQSKSGGMGI
jgi:hypothetical protein